jgi:hypothetical protein
VIWTTAKEICDMTQTTQSSRSSAFSMLEIDGRPAGFLRSAEGGEPFAPVVNETGDASEPVRKHLGATEFAPIRLSFGTGMGMVLYQWMADFLNRNGSARNGVIVFLKYDLTERSRLYFENALITELKFPALDDSSKDPVYFTLTLQPRTTYTSTASMGNQAPIHHAATMPLMGSNYSVNIAGLELACTRVNRIDAIIVKQPMAQTGEGLIPGVLNISNITFRVAAVAANEVYDWFNDFVLSGHSAQQNERTGTIQLHSPNKQTTLFTLTLSNLGISHIWNLRIEDDPQQIQRVGVELYCEEMALTASVAAAMPEAPETTGRPTVEESALRLASSSAIARSWVTLQPQVIAQRLLATGRPAGASSFGSRLRAGISIGELWATESATLEELEQVAALQSGEWSAMKLGNEHSLIVQLREAGVLPAYGDGPLELERDDFIEGIVSGASRVLRSVAPHLSPPT